MSITVDELDSYSATFTITPNEYTFATFYAVFTKATYDEYWADETYLEDFHYLFMEDFNYGEDVIAWGSDPFQYKEEYTLSPGVDYYVVAIPISNAGLDTENGWGEAFAVEFSTPSI